MSDGPFLEQVRNIAHEYPTLKIVDAMTALPHPEKFDVLVTTNMCGDILSGEAGELSGSLGMVASLNSGLDQAVAQAQHGSAPDIAGKDMANPVALIKSAAMRCADWLFVCLAPTQAGQET